MSDATTRRRIRAQGLASDDFVMGFVLDAPVQRGASARFDEPGDVPLACALFAIPGVSRVEVSGATVWVKRDATADWTALKPVIAAAIRQVLDETAAPLGIDESAGGTDPDMALLIEVKSLLDRQVNPAVAAHGGQISADRVDGGTVYLRMSGGCQGCAASSATLRQGVERMLRAALPQIREIVDVTDHAAGRNPFYTRGGGLSPVLDRPIPDGVIGRTGGQITVDPVYLAPKLGLTPQTLHEGLRTGEVTGVTEAGEGADASKTRVILRTASRAWAAEVLSDGSAREIPPPRETGDASDRERDLADRVRDHLAGLAPVQTPITYGTLARALGLWVPGSVRLITGALETTMREDAAAGRPFIATRVVSRGRGNLPGQGFFELARALSRGPREGESDQDFYDRERNLLNRTLEYLRL
ncbi:DUF6522 family protein [Leisingera sp. D0M16]|uniref:DUF6522 family protein n=1 Tax=Leisingera coralii TaxID=3351347 RepID=UPI003B7D5FFD